MPKSQKKGWIDDYTWFTEKRKNKYWNKETCYKEAKKYDNRTAFAKHAEGAYNLAKKNGWIDEYTWFKLLTNYWTYEACKLEAAKYEKRAISKKLLLELIRNLVQMVGLMSFSQITINNGFFCNGVNLLGKDGKSWDNVL